MTRGVGAGALVVPVLVAGMLAVPGSPASAAPAGSAAAAAVPSAAEPCEEGRTQWVTDTPPALNRFAAQRAWALTRGQGVTVAVVDSGVARNQHFPSGTVLDGRSFVGGSPRTDGRLHGTAVAGIIAARSLAPTSGVEGLAPRARILPVKVVPDESDREEGPDTDAGTLAAGIRWAADQGAKVVNVSLSTGRDDAALRSAVAHARSRGALVVASAGNTTTQAPVRAPRYPAAYPGVLGVAATDDADTVAKGSVPGSHVDVAAPGVQVLTTFGAWGDCYLGDESGSTSYATAYVSAAAALVAQRFPAEGPDRWAHRLEVTAARDRRDARDDAVGWGVVQPVEALTAVLDDAMAGPLLPGASPRPTEEAPNRTLAIPLVVDPRAADRRQVLWVAVGGTSALLGLALLRLARRRRRPA
ncbi:S8 family serine peptidase [Phycicoccus sonneratiae]|uniref:S8 family serine peptidase n=1 Tax=Phycicoccus sonneratiae TaxID=2807628 RepID=A0ABS2CH02_9MICO|nr:S8 family serine peptidase [Phycicoccus sonneraticus]MBM6399055.1 S8 family serine peptidase [Phycicoccus sonneraticus]